MGKFLKAAALVTPLLAGVWSLPAAASCYSVYDNNDQLIFQDIESPVDLRRDLTQEVRAKFGANARMVFTQSETGCTPVRNSDEVNEKLARPTGAAAKTAKSGEGN